MLLPLCVLLQDSETQYWDSLAYINGTVDVQAQQVIQVRLQMCKLHACFSALVVATVGAVVLCTGLAMLPLYAHGCTG